MELTLKPAGRLKNSERDYVLSNFFDAHWHNQIFPHPRYKELFEKRYRGSAFTTEDIRDLQMDTDRATIDRPGASYPPRYSWPEDAEAQIQLAVDAYTGWFGRSPRGMWPAEGAVSQSVIPFFVQHGIAWIASDEGVLARSGRYGYETDDPKVLCQPYRAEESEQQISIVFRSRSLSDAIGFHYHGYADYERAAADFIGTMRQEFVDPQDDSDRLLTVILDGENAWGDYREDARPFLEALYSLLERATDIQCVTPAEYLNEHPIDQQTKVYELFTGSWIDQWGSPPGVDLNTWIGDEEKNKAWTILGAVRQTLSQNISPADDLKNALRSIYVAEGSDWFWWFGPDQESGNDEQFDDLFRTHLRNVFKALRNPVPSFIDQHIVPHVITWTFANPANAARRPAIYRDELLRDSEVAIERNAGNGPGS